MERNYQRTLVFYYKDEKEKTFTKKTSFSSKEKALEDLREILAKQTGTNADNWNVITAAITDKKTNAVIWNYKKGDPIK